MACRRALHRMAGFNMLLAMTALSAPAAADPLSGASLYEDVRRYDSFGPHRYGSPGAAQAFDWIATELSRAGFAVSSQDFTMDRQYDFERGSLAVDGRTVDVVPHWWIPEAQETFALAAPIAASGDASGRFVRVTLPFDRTAYLGKTHRAALDAAFARHPAAVLLTIDHPSGEIYTYNVGQDEKPWPAPVILVAGHDVPLLEAAERAGRPVEVSIKGRYRHDVPGRNVIGRLARSPAGDRARSIVVSTPVTSWFTSTCERAPGIAGFLAVARVAAERLVDNDLVFVATAGHEIGHGGMEQFLRAGAPPPAQTVAWAHFGASIACYNWRRDGARWLAAANVDTRVRLINRSRSLEAIVGRRFAGIEGTALTGEKAAIGELRDVHAAGYANFFGMAGLHGLFHTPADNAAGTGPDILEPVARAFAETLIELSPPR